MTAFSQRFRMSNFSREGPLPRSTARRTRRSTATRAGGVARGSPSRIGAEADDLTVEHGAVGAYRVGDLRELRPLLEHVATAGGEGAPVALDDGKGAEAIMLQLEEPVGASVWIMASAS